MAKKIMAIITDSYWPARGGIEQTVQTLAKNLQDHFSVFIITHCTPKGSSLYNKYSTTKKRCTSDPYGTNISYLIATPLQRLILLPLLLWNFPIARKLKAVQLFDFLFNFYKAVYKRKLDQLLDNCSIVHCFSTGYPARCISEVCLQKGIPFIHSPYIHFGKWGDSPAQLQSYSYADAVLCPTESFKSEFQACSQTEPVNLVVIPPVIPEPSIPSISEPPVPERFVLFLGRREPHKGLAMLIVAFAGIETSVKLVIAGPGEPIKTRNDSIVDLGEVDENVKCWLLSSCDFICVPSNDETFGIVFAEAMSYGKPIISLDKPPINEIIQNGQSGLLISPENTDDLRNAIDKLLTDHKMRIYMGEKAKNTYNTYFENQKILKKQISLYNSLIRDTV